MVALLAMSTASVYADDGKYTRSAMLEQGDSIQLFYGLDAFQQAYNAAADSGAVITLSKGEFLGGNEDFSINKSVKIIGYYGFSSKPIEATVFSGNVRPDANYITIDGVYMNNLWLREANNLIVKHSWITNVRAYGYHYNTILDQCVVQDFAPNFFVNGDLIKITNSTLSNVGDFSDIDKNANAAYIKNCVLYENNQRHSCYAMYENNIFIAAPDTYHLYTYYLAYPSIYLHNHFFMSDGFEWEENNRHEGNVAYAHRDVLPTNTYPAYPINAPLGSDGTPVGPLGGSGFTDRPSIPRVTSQSIGFKPDSIGNINVKISVSAE